MKITLHNLMRVYRGKFECNWSASLGAVIKGHTDGPPLQN